MKISDFRLQIGIDETGFRAALAGEKEPVLTEEQILPALVFLIEAEWRLRAAFFKSAICNLKSSIPQ